MNPSATKIEMTKTWNFILIVNDFKTFFGIWHFISSLINLETTGTNIINFINIVNKEDNDIIGTLSCV